MRSSPVVLCWLALALGPSAPGSMPTPRTERLIAGARTYECQASDCGPAQEHLEPRPDGTLSQSWTFAVAPPPGALNVEVALDGVTGTEAVPAGVRLHVGPASFLYSHAMWVDATGARTPVLAQASARGVRLTVPAALQERSTYPAVLDPVLSLEQTVDPSPIRSPVGDAPRVLATSAGTFVTFADQDFGFLYTRVIGLDGSVGPVQGPFDKLGTSPPQLWVLAETDAGVLVVSQPGLALVARTFDPRTGAALGSTHPVWSGQLSVSAAGGQPGQLFVGGVEDHDGGNRPVMLALSDDGVLLGAAADLTTSGRPRAVAAGPRGAWASFEHTTDAGTSLTLAQLSPSGAPSDPTYTLAVNPTFNSALAVDAARVWVVWGEQATTSLAWQWVDDAGLSPMVLGDVGSTPSLVFAAPGPGGELLVAFEPTNGSSLSIARVNVSGLSSTSVAFAGDGGSLVATGMTIRDPPALGVLRRYQERPSCCLTSAHVVQSGAGEGLIDLQQVANAQAVPHVVPLAPRGPSLLTWSDDRIQPDRLVLHGLQLDPSGAPLGPVRALDRLVQFEAAPQHTHHLTSNGEGVLAAISDGLDVYSLPIQLDGGAPLPRQRLTGSLLQFEPHLTAGPSQYLMTWSDSVTSVVGVRVTSTGSPIDGTPVVLQGTFTNWDTLWDGSGYQVVIAAPPGLVVRRLLPTGGPLPATTLAVDAGNVFTIIAEPDGARGVVGWKEQLSDGSANVNVLRYALDGGAPLGPTSTLHLPPSGTFDDLAAWQGHFHALGTVPLDGGSGLWVNQLDDLGQFLEAAPLVVLTSADPLLNPVGGVTLPDGGWLLAYSRRHPELGQVSRVHTRVLSADLALGAPCAGNSECGSRRCVDGVCCDTTCGGGAPGDCMACSVALGAASDGTCGPRGSGTECRAASSSCDVPERCDGTALACPADVTLDPDSGCADADAGVDAPARQLRVGCGCASTSSSAWSLGLVWLLARRRARAERSVTRTCRASPSARR